MVVFVPVALYGFWQKMFGLSNFEERYLLSGLTIITDDYVNSARVFSTLNSNHSFSVTMACCAIIALLQRHLPATGKWQKFLQKRGIWLFTIFIVATLISLRRTGWLVVALTLAGAYCFRSRIRTVIFYSFCFTTGSFLVLNAEAIFAKLPAWENTLQSAIPGFDQGLQLQTFNDRLSSFQTLRDNREIWSFFGLSTDEKETIFALDAITQAIISYGVVGLIAFLSVLVTVLVMSHRLVWQATNVADRRYASLLLSFIFANLFVGAVLQSHIDIFPVNFIFWVCAGALLKITFHQQAIVVVKPTIDLAALAASLKPKQRPAIMAGYSMPGR